MSGEAHVWAVGTRYIYIYAFLFSERVYVFVCLCSCIQGGSRR